jgi:glucan 1,3-beta-glucosidase
MIFKSTAVKSLLSVIILVGAETGSAAKLNSNWTCSNNDPHTTPFDTQVRGTNIGGWLVLEPWITPSLFYQFLGATTPESTAMDTWTFCTALGAEEGNKQLRR